MLSFLASSPKRHPQSHAQTLTIEDGATTIEFLDSSSASNSPYSMRINHKPGDSLANPPYHFHRYQTETFSVEKGLFRATVEGTTTDIHPGNDITITPGLYHKYVNGSDAEPLIVSVRLEPEERERDEAFFRNLYCYMDDCRREGRGPNVAQLCLFLWVFDCPLAVPVVGPKVVGRLLGVWGTWVVGVVVGKWVLGFRESYGEYYRPKVG